MRKTNTSTVRRTKRIHNLVNYLIVTNTKKTEKYYFEGLKDSLPKEIQNKLAIKIVSVDTKNLIKECKRLTTYDNQYRIPWIVFDRDEETDFDIIIEEAKKNNINVGWSNPCFEIWLYAYFGAMPITYDSKECCSKFKTFYKKETGQEYLKNNRNLYKSLYKFGNEKKAIKLAENRLKQNINEDKKEPSQMFSTTTVYKLIKEIKEK